MWFLFYLIGFIVFATIAAIWLRFNQSGWARDIYDFMVSEREWSDGPGPFFLWAAATCFWPAFLLAASVAGLARLWMFIALSQPTKPIEKTITEMPPRCEHGHKIECKHGYR